MQQPPNCTSFLMGNQHLASKCNSGFAASQLAYCIYKQHIHMQYTAHSWHVSSGEQLRCYQTKLILQNEH